MATNDTNLYKVTRQIKKSETFSPLAVTIINVIRSAENPLSRADIVSKLSAAGLQSKQTPAKVFSIFRPRLIEAGILREIKPKVATKRKAAVAAAAASATETTPTKSVRTVRKSRAASAASSN